MACFVPTDFTQYPRVFKALLDWYKWRRVSIICDAATTVQDFYFLSVLRAQCRDFATVLRLSSNLIQNSSTAYNEVHNILKDLKNGKARQEALLKAKSFSRSKF